MLKKSSSKKVIVLNIVFILIISISVQASILAPGFSDGLSNNSMISVPVPADQPLDITDPVTGVTLNIPAGALPDGVTSISFSVTAAPFSMIEAAQQAANVSGSSNLIKVNSIFDLVLLDQNGNYITLFNSAISVTIPVTDDSNTVIYFNELEQSIEILPGTMQNGFITFTPNHFSYYALAKMDISENYNYNTDYGIDIAGYYDDADKSGDFSQSGNQTQSDMGIKPNPPTHDNLLLFFILAGLSFWIFKIYKKKSKVVYSMNRLGQYKAIHINYYL